MDTVTDISKWEVAAGMAGTVSLGFVIMLVMESVKDFWPSLEGRKAAACVHLVAFAAVALFLTIDRSNWTAVSTWGIFVVSGLMATVVARGIYHTLFHDKATIVPEPEGREVPLSATVPASQSPPDAPESSRSRPKRQQGVGVITTEQRLPAAIVGRDDEGEA